MPLSEFLRLAIEKLEASKKKSCSADLSVSGTENNLVEGHSLSPATPSVRDATLRNECLGGVDSSYFDDISPVAPSGELDLSQNDEVVPCLNYPVDDGLQDYFSEISGVKTKETSGSKRSSCDQAVRYLDNGHDAFKFSSSKARSLCSWPLQQGQTSRLSRISSINTNNTSDCQDVMFGNVVGDSSKANVPISGGISSSVSSGVKRVDPASRCSNPVKSMLMQRLTSKPKDMDFCIPSSPTMVNSGQLSVKEHKEKDTYRKTSSTTVLDGGRTVEPVFASSSVGSGNSADRVSYEETHNLKRNFCDIESECHSDDVQIESIGVQKPTAARGDTGAKKSRTAEVHNLSERRRRDRINDKMRALQELVPNCNKADKASMLDDAIQYLKNLQHQVQSMSMGAGMCVPPMMFTPGSQHMYPAPIPHYSPMGMGMGMGMGIGMGMNMSYPVFPVPSIQGMGHANFQGTHAPNLSMHGHLCPGFHTPVPRAPSIPFTGPHHSSMRIPSRNEVPTTSLNLNSEDPMKSTNSNAEAHSPINRANNQGSG